ncbi:MAG: hypothetical protein H6545_03490 [Bacteroidales bacterium]|jgi:hypothetical protein|nr:hypothetical protein [Bacteroidales bacterium]MCB9028166.1 hypothetical protein [Bacteroidales bacterium]MDD3735598.1 hypothetical protein [Bacteroidales bacterium]NLD62694.1 hypothetical protein [Bacteroidales bacterium]HNT92797.1 hypothetical protein [Bacteroidales bacterium]
MAYTDDMEFIRPFPRPFVMHAMQYFGIQDLNPAQRKAITSMILEYCKRCAEEEAHLIQGIITEINNLESKG